MALYDRIGVGYDTTRSADPYLLSRMLHHLRPRAAARYLDVGCGTGNYAAAMREEGLRVVGLDFAATMLNRAREKHPSMAWVRARGEAIPFPARAFAGATCTFVHHHMEDPARAFAEVYRVVEPGARFVLLNATVEQTRGYWLLEYFPRMMAQAMAPFERLDTVGALTAAGFRIECEEQYEIRRDLRDNFLYCGKHRPEMYLDPRVRTGISSFANAADQDEIEKGVERIAQDIASGRIENVIRSYAHDKGDYMFTGAAK